MATGWLAGQAARDFTPTDKGSFASINLEESPEFKTTKYFCKTNFDMGKIKREEKRYIDQPKLYDFGSERNKQIMLNRCFKGVNDDIDRLVSDLLGTGQPVE